jgi:hypothetical protein
MSEVTPASIAYIATQASFIFVSMVVTLLTLGVSQVRFALSSSPVFSRTDTITDSETFYNSLLSLLEDEEEKDEIRKLLVWWNRCVYFHTLHGCI